MKPVMPEPRYVKDGTSLYDAKQNKNTGFKIFLGFVILGIFISFSILIYGVVKC
jgi:hypothetical protein